MEQIILSHEFPMVPLAKQIYPPLRLGACSARRRAVTAEESGNKPQMNTDKHRCGFNNSINIFRPEHSTINIQCQHQEVTA